MIQCVYLCLCVVVGSRLLCGRHPGKLPGECYLYCIGCECTCVNVSYWTKGHISFFGTELPTVCMSSWGGHCFRDRFRSGSLVACHSLSLCFLSSTLLTFKKMKQWQKSVHLMCPHNNICTLYDKSITQYESESVLLLLTGFVPVIDWLNGGLICLWHLWDTCRAPSKKHVHKFSGKSFIWVFLFSLSPFALYRMMAAFSETQQWKCLLYRQWGKKLVFEKISFSVQ